MKINFLNFKTMKTIRFYAMTALTVAMLASCSSDDDASTPPVEPEEAITRLVITFENQNDANDTVVLTWNDDNEDEVVDANERTVVGEFDVSQVYDAEIGLFNLDEDFLEEDITSMQEGIDAHFFVYGTDLGFTMERAANDFSRSDNNKLGVFTTWTAGSTAGNGTISVALYHESPGVDDSDGFGSAQGTDTDIDVSFDVVLQ